MDKVEALKKAALFIEAVVGEYHPAQIILFGSYAKGTQHEDSDIDIAVILDKIEGSFLDKEARLYTIRRNIDPSIEPVLIESTSDDSGFLQQILSYGEVLYTKSA